MNSDRKDQLLIIPSVATETICRTNLAQVRLRKRTTTATTIDGASRAWPNRFNKLV